MGASDEYIMRQFQRHALVIALQGSGLGTLAAGLVLLALKMAGSENTALLLPAFTVHALEAAAVAALPLMACLIAVLTARVTVLRSLSLMP